jgi:mitogen-activated protein kinase kinase 4
MKRQKEYQHVSFRSTVDEKEQKQLLMDLEVVMNSSDCSFIVQFYGAIFKVPKVFIFIRVADPDDL